MTARVVLITGCSSGFGRVTALHLAACGWRVLAVVRKPADAESLTAEASQRGVGARLEPLLCAITEADQVAGLAVAVAERTAALHGLINNAGTAYPGVLETLPLDDLRAQFEINVFAQVAVTQALLPALRRGRGTVINVSSMGGRVTFPVTGAYHASKFALEALSDAWRVELAPLGVRVVVIEPAGSPTGIWQAGETNSDRTSAHPEAGVYTALQERARQLARASGRSGFAPERFARLVERVLNTDRPASRYAIPLQAQLTIWAGRLAPDWLWDWLVRRVFRW